MDKTIVAAVIGAVATIAAAVIGVYAGKSYEKNIVQNQIEEVMGDNVNVIGDGNTITVNDVKSLAESYIKLQDQYDELQNQNNFLLGENVRYSNDLQEANNKISELSSETDQQIEDLKNQLNSMISVQLTDIALSIDGENIPINSSNSSAVINNRTYYSEEILKKLISPNTNMTIQDNTMYIGRIIRESSYLLDEWVVDSDNVSTVNNITDSLGGTHINALLFSNHGKIIYNLENEYSLIKFKLALDGGTYLNFEGILTIKADDRIVYESPILTKTNASYDEADIPIYNCSLLTIEFNYTYSWGKCIMSDIVIYN